MASINTTQLFGRGDNATFSYTVKGLNTVSNYLFFDFLLIALFLIVIFALRGFELRDGLLSASVVTWIFSIVLWISDFVDFTRVVVCFSLIVVAIGFSYFKE